MRKLLLSALIFFALLTSARADAFGRNWEGEWLVGFGSDFNQGRPGMPAMFRLRCLNHGVPFALEASFYFPYGVGANLLLDVYRGSSLRLHVIDLGLFVPFSEPERLVRMDVDRSVDVTVGAGMEYRFSWGGILAVDWRVFLPNPTVIPFYYGGFALGIYRDSAKGGQLWVTFGKRF